jgi:hypothetical protein
MTGPTTSSGTERPVQDKSGQDMRTGQVNRTCGKFRHRGHHAGQARPGHEDRSR